MRNAGVPLNAGSSFIWRASSIIARAVSSPVRPPTAGLSPWTNKNSPTPYAAAVSMSRRNPSRFRSREFRQAILAPPMALTSCATAMLDTVARPTWLSGIRNERATGARTPI
jgi:hypothetical protein